MSDQTRKSSPKATRQTGSGASPADDEGVGRSERKRRGIMEAATGLFLRDGYLSTSMDQIAAAASVSKQTVYKHFADKEQLFREIVFGVTNAAEGLVKELAAPLQQGDINTDAEVRAALTKLALRYIDGVLQPAVLALRRLVIAEADRFPDLARAYYEQAPARGIDVIANALAPLAEKGLLRMDDPRLAAAQLAYLILAIPQDRAQFCPDDRPSTAERKRFAAQGVHVFLAAYGA